MVKNPPANAGDARPEDCLDQEDPPEEEMATCSSILAWRGAHGYSPWDCKESDMTEQTHTHTRA